MRALWNPEDLRHLQLVPEPGREPTAGRGMSDCVSPADQHQDADGPRSTRRSRSPQEAASRPAPPRRKPTDADLADMQDICETVVRIQHDVESLLADLRTRDPLDVLIGARQVMTTGLRLGALSRRLESRL